MNKQWLNEAIDSDSDREEIRNIHIQNGSAVATDGYSMFIESAIHEEDKPVEDFPKYEDVVPNPNECTARIAIDRKRLLSALSHCKDDYVSFSFQPSGNDFSKRPLLIQFSNQCRVAVIAPMNADKSEFFWYPWNILEKHLDEKIAEVDFKNISIYQKERVLEILGLD